MCLLGGCDQFGNPPPFATGPTDWQAGVVRLVTTTRSFRDEKTIQRLTSKGLGKLDHADASIGPSQTLTVVSVEPHGLSIPPSARVPLVTTFELRNGARLRRQWSAPASSRRWNAAFALPEPPLRALTSVVP
jgi:hypothetical protein